MPKIGIITINFNNSEGLDATIHSVAQQTFSDFEHIIIDGDSIDGSKALIEKHQKKFSYWISESDSGVYEAMNKGIRASKGSYLLFLNSGDTLHDPMVLEQVAQRMDSALDIYYGDVLFTSTADLVQTYPDVLSFSYFTKRSLGHPASFIKKELFERVFYYNEHLKICSDWEFFICAICKYNATYEYIPLVVANFDTNGMSSDETYTALIAKEKRTVLDTHFAFFMNEFEQFESLVRKIEKPPYSQLTHLLKSRISRKLVLVTLRVLSFVFPNKKKSNH